MDWDDDGVPPPIRRASREALELQKALDEFSLDTNDLDDDDAAPPPIRRLRTSSLGSSPSKSFSKPPAPSPKQLVFPPDQDTDSARYATPPARTLVLPYSHSPLPTRTPAPKSNQTPDMRVNTGPAPSHDAFAPPLPNKSPLRSQPEPEPLKRNRLNNTRNFSYPFKDRSQTRLRLPSQPKYVNASSFRNPSRPLSYRNNSRMPYSLRRWSSLETIDSVQTTQETERESSLERSESVHTTDTTNTTNTSDSKRQFLSFCDDDKEEVGEEYDDTDTKICLLPHQLALCQFLRPLRIIHAHTRLQAAQCDLPLQRRMEAHLRNQQLHP
ncbi:hypothetical protein BU23DRAFT_140038 [Bimuria novae-zelandiae CBS 107.79]|uniref:Uncharacterized protein n=1 Tax=Bimuria novae-zelandiae CBS 107.79 TaxID=1447943 RepID=A0A6A5VB41_9PLEO|nr:hypothetical protein BU23DRAFT_140038 [Bimuria novae-zelandiae CBS 107.79]